MQAKNDVPCQNRVNVKVTVFPPEIVDCWEIIPDNVLVQIVSPKFQKEEKNTYMKIEILNFCDV